MLHRTTLAGPSQNTTFRPTQASDARALTVTTLGARTCGLVQANGGLRTQLTEKQQIHSISEGSMG